MVETKQSLPNMQMTESEAALIEAAVAETVEHGYSALTAEAVARRAGVPLSAFYESFADEQGVVEAAHETLFGRFEDRLLRACETQPTWPLKVKVGIGVTLDLAAASPVKARFLTLDMLAANRELVRRVFESRDRLSRLLAPGRAETPRGAELPGLVEQALVAAVAGVVSSQLRAGQAEHLPALAPQLVELTLLPYLGSEQAAAVASRPRLDIQGL